jgi:hypothetical protein
VTGAVEPKNVEAGIKPGLFAFSMRRSTYIFDEKKHLLWVRRSG